jgi:hypothetical protein
MKRPTKIYPAVITPYRRAPMGVHERLAATLADMGARALIARNSTFALPDRGLAAFVARQHKRIQS